MRPHQSFGFALIEAKYERWVGKHEYDGMESLNFKSTEYVLDKVKEHVETFGNLRCCECDELQLEAEMVKLHIVQTPEDERISRVYYLDS